MPAPSHPPPLLGTDAEFQALRAALSAAEFTEQAVCWRMNLKQISDFPLDGKLLEGVAPTDQLGALIWFLMYGAPCDARATAHLPIAELRALGLAAELSGGRAAATAMLYPLRGLWIASDRPSTAGDSATGPFDDFVYPAIIANTLLFLDLVPFEACDA